jgi:uncharacterized peroxidase-related enzyme
MEHAFPLVSTETAQGDVAEVFDDIRRKLDIPFVPNIHRTMASSPAALKGTWSALSHIYLGSSLPSSLASMIMFAISAAKRCQYCTAVHQVTCKSLGLDDDALAALAENISEVAPERVQAIVKFGIKTALTPQDIDQADYDAVRTAGLTDEEIVEVVALAGLANLLDTLADGLKLPVDQVFQEILGS